MARFVLQDQPDWTVERIQEAMEKGESRTLRLKQPLRVLIAYSTVVVKGGRVFFYPDLYGQLDGEIDAVAGHGTFIAGIVRQAAPDADILSIRVAGALGVVDESTLLETVAQVVTLLARLDKCHVEADF